MKVNLGCGNDVREGWENYDMIPVSDDVKFIDLTKLPLPFSDDYADEVLLSHILEHLVYRTEFMLEISRILKPGGICKVVLPTFNFGLDHKSCIHAKGTLASVCTGLVKKDNITHGNPRPFGIIDFRYGWGSPILFLRNAMQVMKTLFHSNIQVVMKNKK